MKPTLFWAWQSDAENNLCRGFIKNAAEKALKVLMKSGEVQDAPRLDHATKEVSGTPELAGTIYAKIEAAGLFLGDVTLVGRRKQRFSEKVSGSPDPFSFRRDYCMGGPRGQGR